MAKDIMDLELETLILQYTERCNSHCVSCGNWRIENPKTLSMECIDKLLSKIRQMSGICVTGGEPYISPQIVEIAHVVNKYHPQCFWANVTNAIDPNTLGRILEIWNAGFKHRMFIEVSLEGSEEIHDIMRGTPGNYQNVIRLIDGLKQNNIPFHMACSFEPGIEEAKRLNLPWVTGPLRYGIGYNLPESTADKFKMRGCPGIRRFLACDAEGNLYPCNNYKPEILIGNLSQVWEGMRWAEVKAHLEEDKCVDCNMWSYRGK